MIDEQVIARFNKNNGYDDERGDYKIIVHE